MTALVARTSTRRRPARARRGSAARLSASSRGATTCARCGGAASSSARCCCRWGLARCSPLRGLDPRVRRRRRRFRATWHRRRSRSSTSRQWRRCRRRRACTWSTCDRGPAALRADRRVRDRPGHLAGRSARDRGRLDDPRQQRLVRHRDSTPTRKRCSTRCCSRPSAQAGTYRRTWPRGSSTPATVVAVDENGRPLRGELDRRLLPGALRLHAAVRDEHLHHQRLPAPVGDRGEGEPRRRDRARRRCRHCR